MKVQFHSSAEFGLFKRELKLGPTFHRVPKICSGWKHHVSEQPWRLSIHHVSHAPDFLWSCQPASLWGFKASYASCATATSNMFFAKSLLGHQD